MELEKANKHNINDYTLAKNVAEKLEEKYPGWLWAVHVMDGVIGVKSMRLSGQWGFILHADKIDNDYKVVVHAGGEILFSNPLGLANWQTLNGAGAAGDLANNDELYNIHPMTFILSFEK